MSSLTKVFKARSVLSLIQQHIRYMSAIPEPNRNPSVPQAKVSYGCILLLKMYFSWFRSDKSSEKCSCDMQKYYVYFLDAIHILSSM